MDEQQPVMVVMAQPRTPERRGVASIDELVARARLHAVVPMELPELTRYADHFGLWSGGDRWDELRSDRGECASALRGEAPGDESEHLRRVRDALTPVLERVASSEDDGLVMRQCTAGRARAAERMIAWDPKPFDWLRWIEEEARTSADVEGWGGRIGPDLRGGYGLREGGDDDEALLRRFSTQWPLPTSLHVLWRRFRSVDLRGVEVFTSAQAHDESTRFDGIIPFVDAGAVYGVDVRSPTSLGEFEVVKVDLGAARVELRGVARSVEEALLWMALESLGSDAGRFSDTGRLFERWVAHREVVAKRWRDG